MIHYPKTPRQKNKTFSNLHIYKVRNAQRAFFVDSLKNRFSLASKNQWTTAKCLCPISFLPKLLLVNLNPVIFYQLLFGPQFPYLLLSCLRDNSLLSRSNGKRKSKKSLNLSQFLKIKEDLEKELKLKKVHGRMLRNRKFKVKQFRRWVISAGLSWSSQST